MVYKKDPWENGIQEHWTNVEKQFKGNIIYNIDMTEPKKKFAFLKKAN